MENNRKFHRSPITQTPIYLGKFFRMFIYMDDWKVIPMAVIIASVVGFVISKMMFTTMEGTVKGGLAIACVCVWNGCFNSIQVVCRERGIIKREHRSGMHITSYIAAHMIYQGFLCGLQTVVTVVIFYMFKMKYPVDGLVTKWFIVDFAITIFLITYSADMLSLFVSCIAKTTTAAMTIMPFILIFQLIFAGTVFPLTGTAQALTNVSIAKWGIQALCAEGHYNDLPMSMAWTMLEKMEHYEYQGQQPLVPLMEEARENNGEYLVGMEAAKQNQNKDYNSTKENVENCWTFMIVLALVAIFASVHVLRKIDKDRR